MVRLTDDDMDGDIQKSKAKKPRLKLRVYSQKDADTLGDSATTFLEDGIFSIFFVLCGKESAGRSVAASSNCACCLQGL